MAQMASPSLLQSASSSTKISMIIQPHEGLSTAATTTGVAGGPISKGEQQLERKGKVMRGTLWNVKCSVPTTTRISVVDDDEVVLPPVQTAAGSANAGEEVLKAQNGENGREHGEKLWSYDEISRHKSEDDAWIVVDGKVYDVTQFLESHPGGPELILEHLQTDGAKDAGPLMKGKISEDGHSHSKAAFRMLKQFLVGSVEASPGSVSVESHGKKYRYNVDLTKPIVSQVGYLGADYDEWVHDPVVCKESPRFFEKDIYEFFTRTSWWVIPLVWCPVAFAMIYIAIAKEGVPLTRIPALLAYGVGVWTFLEYLLHRFLFHMKTSSFWGNTLHYLLHGFHHKHPMDGSRLVFPPAFASVICTGIWFLMGSWLAPYPDKLPVYAAALLSYVTYDVTHYFLHFGTPFNDHSRRMKRYHLNHHFKDQTNGYGITSTIWDWVFRTLPPLGKLSMD
ncbi:unnamed protein product [Calypogeia fissa]